MIRKIICLCMAASFVAAFSGYTYGQDNNSPTYKINQEAITRTNRVLNHIPRPWSRSPAKNPNNSDNSAPDTGTKTNAGFNYDTGYGNSIFYGVNGHALRAPYTNSTTAQQLSYLQQLGMTMYRNDLYNDSQAATISALASEASTWGINISPIVIVDATSFNTESDAYQTSFALGQAAAKRLKGQVIAYEIGNEYDMRSQINTSSDGMNDSDYDEHKFELIRGTIRGTIAGIKSVDTKAKIAMNSVIWLHYGFLQMLWDGRAPDGTSGHPRISWDITTYHWYSGSGDMTKAYDQQGNTHNVLQELKTRFNKPIWITEYGTSNYDGGIWGTPGVPTDAQKAKALVGSTLLGGFVDNARIYNITSVQLYELYDDQNYGGDGNFGLIKDDTKTRKPQFSAVQSFIAAHPM